MRSDQRARAAHCVANARRSLLRGAPKRHWCRSVQRALLCKLGRRQCGIPLGSRCDAPRQWCLGAMRTVADPCRGRCAKWRRLWNVRTKWLLVGGKHSRCIGLPNRSAKCEPSCLQSARVWPWQSSVHAIVQLSGQHAADLVATLWARAERDRYPHRARRVGRHLGCHSVERALIPYDKMVAARAHGLPGTARFRLLLLDVERQ